MTPKEKAQELVDKFDTNTVLSLKKCKECALIAAQEVRNAFDDCQIQPILAGTLGPIEWDEVIKELKKP